MLDIIIRIRMAENNRQELSYRKAGTARKMFRDQLFERNRHDNNKLEYLKHYEMTTRTIIIKSLEQPIPVQLLTKDNVRPETIAFYRRNSMFVYKTRMVEGGPLDPHMLYTSLWILSSSLEMTEYQNKQQVIQQFEQEFNLYYSMPYKQIREAALIVAGNRVIGRPQDIVNAVTQNHAYVWVMINHIFERRVDYAQLAEFVNKDIDVVYRSIFEMTNTPQDEIIYTIISRPETLQAIVDAFNSQNRQIQLYAIKIIGNILAEAENYASDISKYDVLDRVVEFLTEKRPDLCRDSLWMLCNYASEHAAAVELINKSMLMEKLITLLYRKISREIKQELYFLLTNLVRFGHNEAIFNFIGSNDILQQCTSDFEIEDTDLRLYILSLITEIMTLGQEYADPQKQTPNPVIEAIKANSSLRGLLNEATFSQNQDISALATKILDATSEQASSFGIL